MATYYKYISENKLLRVISEFKDDCLKLTVLDNNTAWETTVDKAELTAFAGNQEFESYYNNLQKYFQPLKLNEELDFVNGKFTVRTTLKNQMKVVLFYTTMKQFDFNDTVYTKLDEFNQNASELNKVKEKYAVLQQEHQVLKRKMDEFLECKKNEELAIYNMFVGILNEKKLQIQHLNELLTAFRAGRPTVNPPPAKSRIKKAPKAENIQVDSDAPALKRFASDNGRESPQPSTSKIESPLPESPLPPVSDSDDESENEKDDAILTEVKKEEPLAVNFNTQELLNEL